MPQTGVEHMGDVGHKMLGKELKSRENRQKRLKSIGKTMRQLFAYSVEEIGRRGGLKVPEIIYPFSSHPHQYGVSSRR